MFPPKIMKFVDELRQRTNQGNIVWNYDDNANTVMSSNPQFSITLRYSFSDVIECGEFTLFYYDSGDGKEYRFYTNSNFIESYENARMLYEAAQSSGLKLPF